MERKRPPLPYFIENPMTQENRNGMDGISDRDYFRQMYPAATKRYLRVIVDVLDRMDIKDSYIYDEYPDKIRIERLTEIILRLIPLEDNVNRETQRSLVKILLMDEIVERRKLKISNS